MAQTPVAIKEREREREEEEHNAKACTKFLEAEHILLYTYKCGDGGRGKLLNSQKF